MAPAMEDTQRQATGKEIILEIVRSLRANLEPLLFSTVAPTRFFVYLHPADHQRLEGIFPLLLDQARRALDQEVRSWNEKARSSRLTLKWLGGDQAPPPIEPPQEAWDIRFEPDADGEMQPGDIAIASELALPREPEFDGTRTRRITTLRQGDATSTREQVLTAASPKPATPGDTTASASAGTVLGTLTYEDRRGRQVVPITKEQLVIGRGGVGYWVDVKLDTAADVSREHLRLRRDGGTGQFFLKDLSTLGTTVDGQSVPSSIEVVEGRKHDKGIEVPLPPRARIGLANVIVLEFEAGSRA
jgi:pSer/pThr/pTyr-binding forkhead associated (FHA) protein